MIIHSFAKINLALHVLNRRPDGYHNIETVFQSISLKDRLIIRKSPDLKVTTDNPEVPEGKGNLAYRAALLVKKAFAVKENVHIHIEKRIPMGAGLAGGSSNAAAAIRGLLKFWKIGPEKRKVKRILRQLGSDVPFCFTGGTQLGRGRGERLTPLPPFPKYFVVLVNPGIHVSTPWAYKSLKRNLTQSKKIANLTKGYADLLKKRLTLREFLHNDFEGIVLKTHPAIRRIKTSLRAFKPEGALMSGSGSTVFALFRERRRAAGAARYFRGLGHFAFLSTTLGGVRS